MLSFCSFILVGPNKEEVLNTVSFFSVRSRRSSCNTTFSSNTRTACFQMLENLPREAELTTYIQGMYCDDQFLFIWKLRKIKVCCLMLEWSGRSSYSPPFQHGLLKFFSSSCLCNTFFLKKVVQILSISLDGVIYRPSFAVCSFQRYLSNLLSIHLTFSSMPSA